MADLKDSGARRDFGTGAVRDVAEGKGRCDLLPMDVVALVLNDPTLELIEGFKRSKDHSYLVRAIQRFGPNTELPDILLEVSLHFEDGARKYGENNWQRGIPTHCYIDSATRHYLKHLRGDTDEPHHRAYIWNLMCCIWTMINKPEMDDIQIDIAPKT